MRHAGRYLSELNQGRFTGLKAQKEQLAMARAPEDLSKKFRYNQRRELRLLEEAGGVVRPISDFSARQIAAMYLDLFQRRWGFAATGAERMADVLERLRELLIGSVLMLDDKPIAIQLVYRVEAPEWISVEYINGGVDPETKAFSPGSVLSSHTSCLGGRPRAQQTTSVLVRSCRPRIQGPLVQPCTGVPGVSRKQQLLKRHRRNKRLGLLAGLVALVCLGVFAWWWLPLLLLPLLWAAHEAWFADHLFYAPNEDYVYHFGDQTRESPVSWRDGRLKADALLQGDETLILEVRLKSGWLGRFLDPCVHLLVSGQIGKVAMTPLAVGSVLFQGIMVSFVSYLTWFWLLRKYLASTWRCFRSSRRYSG